MYNECKWIEDWTDWVSTVTEIWEDDLLLMKGVDRFPLDFEH